MNLENTVKSSPKAWQKLLCQAFSETEINTSQAKSCSLFDVRHFVYQSLQNTGIQNRSPFSLWQLVKIRLQSKGNPQQVRDLCIDSVLNMSKPAFCLLSSSFHLVLTSTLLSLVTLLTPITATTFKSQEITESILKVPLLPWKDNEMDEISLPLSSDYLLAATIDKSIKLEQPPGTLNASSWILDQQNSAYSLQLLSVSNKNNLLIFCKKHDICEKSAYYSTQVKGKKLIRLIYGSYPNHQAAKLAKAELKSIIKGIDPWARSFEKIKNEL